MKYDWDAKDYEKHSQAQRQWARELIAKLDLKGTEDVLDLGCGDGKVTAEIASYLHSGLVVGVDNSRAMIELAVEQHPSNLYKNLSFVVMDAIHLPFRDQFGIVFSSAALHWVKNHKSVVEGLYRSLKSGGKILLQMGGKGNAEKILSILTEIQSRKEWQPYFNNFDFPYGFLGTEEYTRLLNEAGFTINRLELIPKEMVHEGQSGLEGWIRTTWLPCTERIPVGKRNQFISTLAAEYIQQFPMDSNHKVYVAMVRIEVEATKNA